MTASIPDVDECIGNAIDQLSRAHDLLSELQAQRQSLDGPTLERVRAAMAGVRSKRETVVSLLSEARVLALNASPKLHSLIDRALIAESEALRMMGPP